MKNDKEVHSICFCLNYFFNMPVNKFLTKEGDIYEQKNTKEIT